MSILNNKIVFRPHLYGWSIAVVGICTFIGILLRNLLTPIDQDMIYLMGIVLVASRFGRGPSVLSSLLSVTCFNFFFVEPLYTLAIYDQSYWFTFLAMFTTSLVISTQVKARLSATEMVKKSKTEVDTEKLRNTLLSSVSHDLRTPLATITGASSSIVLDSESMPRGTIKALAASINLEASRLASIVTNLLQITRMESGSLSLNKQLYFIEELIGAVLMRMETQLSNHNIIKNAEANLPVLNIDGVLIEQVLTNLLENSAKFTPARGNIYIFASCSGNELQVTISDSGAGITVGEEKKIFEKFYTSTHVRKGTGLGLTICYAIITAHGGRIWAENRMEGGTKVAFTLPVIEIANE